MPLSNKKPSQEFDPLTSLLTRKSLRSQLHSLFRDGFVQVHQGNDAIHSLIMCDIDYFKSLNDIYSHAQGDKVLEIVGSVLMQSPDLQNGTCIAGRWGGEELLLVIPNDLEHIAQSLAEGVREQISKTEIANVTGPAGQILPNPVTVSIGVHYVNIRSGINRLSGIPDSYVQSREPMIDAYYIEALIADALARADVSLSYAKFSGRNKVEVFTERIAQEIQNLSSIRRFYFMHSYKSPQKLQPLFQDEFLTKNRSIRGKMNKHFAIIRTEISPQDTRTQAIFADRLYSDIVRMSEEAKSGFISFISHYL